MSAVADAAVGRRVTLADERLEVVVLPDHGADIASIVVAGDVELLFQTPWGRRDRALLPARADSQTAWLDRYGGGWQVLCPNAGFECEGEGGARWGYHGEASLLAWDLLDAGPDRAELEVELLSAPLRLHRFVRLRAGALTVRECVTNLSRRDVDVMWVQHPAFGAPLIDAGARIETTARRVSADPEIPGDLLAAGGTWDWPHAGGVDLSALPGADAPRALFAYLHEFPAGADPAAAIVNDALGLAVRLRWSADPWPLAWLWQEVHASAGHPWFARAHVCALEPASTMPGLGAARAREHGGALVRVPAGGTRAGWVELTVTATEEPA